MNLPPHSVPCSILILTRNSAQTLERCLRNLGCFGEILIHDGNSTDDTVLIAKRFGARVLKQEETDEPLVRVKNFTEMRLRQRAAARHDWVFYLDSDEFLSDSLVTEIADVVRTAPIKTILKVPRVPVIDGIPRIYGALTPDVMPRLHHRKSGCTLQSNKAVHEKYVYDASFKEIIAKHPLYVPLPAASELRSKDDRYLLLEIERIWKNGYGWGRYLRWVLLREPLVMLVLMLRILRVLPGSFRRESIPLSHHWRYVRYHWRLFRGITGAMLRHPLMAGRVTR